jgi:hypothetical protein
VRAGWRQGVDRTFEAIKDVGFPGQFNLERFAERSIREVSIDVL